MALQVRSKPEWGVVVLLTMFLCYLPGVSHAQPDQDKELSLQAALSMALDGNPNLAQMQARSEALAAIPSQKGALPDPILSFNALNLPTDTFNLAQEPMTQLQFGVTQALPFPGKLGLRREASDFVAKAAAESVDEVRLRLLQGVKSSWWQLHYLDRALEIVINNQELFRQFVDIANTKYTVGEGLQQDVLLSQVELSKLLDQQIKLTGIRRNVEAGLNKLLDRAANTAIVLPKRVDLRLGNIALEDSLYEKAMDRRPLLSQLRFKVEAARSRLDLAYKDYYPDFKAGAFYGVRSGDNPVSIGGSRADFLSLKLSLNIPLFADQKQDKAVVQRLSEVRQSRYALQDAVNVVRSQITQASADYQRAKEQFQLFKDGIIPQSRQTVDSMLSGYQVNKVDFLNLVGSQITLLKYESQYWKSLTEANQALARLTASVGEEVSHE